MPTVRAGLRRTPLRVLVAPNAFKGSLTAQEAAAAMATGVRRASADARCVLRPMADGGDGSLDAFVAAGFARRSGDHARPDRRSRSPPRLASDGSTAVVELASSCGLGLLPGGEPAPMTSTTDGPRRRDPRGPRHRPVARSSCAWAGARRRTAAPDCSSHSARDSLAADGAVVEPGGAWLQRIAEVDLTLLDPRLHDTDIVIAADVTSPLHGPDGAAAVFAPQKGATRDEVAELDAGLRSWAGVLARATGRDVAVDARSGCGGRRRCGTARCLRRDRVARSGADRRPRRPRRGPRGLRPRPHRRGPAGRAEHAGQGSGPRRGACPGDGRADPRRVRRRRPR